MVQGLGSRSSIAAVAISNSSPGISLIWPCSQTTTGVPVCLARWIIFFAACRKAASALDDNGMSCTFFSFMELYLGTSFDFFEEIGIEQLEFAPFFLSDNGRREP